MADLELTEFHCKVKAVEGRIFISKLFHTRNRRNVEGRGQVNWPVSAPLCFENCKASFESRVLFFDVDQIILDSFVVNLVREDLVQGVAQLLVELLGLFPFAEELECQVSSDAVEGRRESL